MSSRSRLTAIVGLPAALALALAGCGGGGSGSSGGGQGAGQPQGGGGKIAVVASTNVWGSVAEAVGGDAVQVKSIIKDPSADPHSYQAEPADATALAGAKLAISNGAGYDDFFTKLAGESGGDARKIVAFDLSGKGEGQNEHVWYDLPTVRKVADKVAEELGAIAPDKKDTFAANAKTFDTALEQLEAKAKGIGTAKPGARVVATEPVAHYLLQTAGVTDATPKEFSEAVEEETDPPAEAVAATTKLVSDKQVAALVDNVQTETPVTKQLDQAATAAGVPVVQVTETLPEGVTGYLDWMTKQVDALAGALGK